MKPKQTFSLTLPSAVVVSGASSGLGREVCELLMDCGVIAIGVDLAPATVEFADRQDYIHFSGDVTEEATWAKVLEKVRDLNVPSIGMVVSAAILEVGSILETSKEVLTRMLNVNVVGAALAIKALMPQMIANGGGPIVVVGSVSASFAEQQLAAYSASKAAVKALARTIAMDHARQGIRVNVVSPGPMMAGLFTRHLESAADKEKFLATRAARQPLGSILNPKEVAHAVLFLLSNQAGAFIGADLMADGGLTTSFDFRTGAEGSSI